MLGLVRVPFAVTNSWFSGDAELMTYQFEELLGTKLRALYQRKKGRDFLTDVTPLLRPDIIFNPQEAYQIVYGKLIDKMAGKRE